MILHFGERLQRQTFFFFRIICTENQDWKRKKRSLLITCCFKTWNGSLAASGCKSHVSSMLKCVICLCSNSFSYLAFLFVLLCHYSSICLSFLLFFFCSGRTSTCFVAGSRVEERSAPAPLNQEMLSENTNHLSPNTNTHQSIHPSIHQQTALDYDFSALFFHLSTTVQNSRKSDIDTEWRDIWESLKHT